MEVCRDTDKARFYLNDCFYIDNLDKISRSYLKTICTELLKLKVINLETRFKENRLDKQLKFNFTAKEILQF
jgi:hypothetical protein